MQSTTSTVPLQFLMFISKQDKLLSTLLSTCSSILSTLRPLLTWFTAQKTFLNVAFGKIILCAYQAAQTWLAMSPSWATPSWNPSYYILTYPCLHDITHYLPQLLMLLQYSHLTMNSKISHQSFFSPKWRKNSSIIQTTYRFV